MKISTILLVVATVLSPATASAAEVNAFNTVAAEIDKSVTELGYPQAVAQDLVGLARD